MRQVYSRTQMLQKRKSVGQNKKGNRRFCFVRNYVVLLFFRISYNFLISFYQVILISFNDVFFETIFLFFYQIQNIASYLRLFESFGSL